MLTGLAAIKKDAIAGAPSGWVEHYDAWPGPPLLERLFLESIEVDDHLNVSLAFDFGDLDMLLVRLDTRGACTSADLCP